MTILRVAPAVGLLVGALVVGCAEPPLSSIGHLSEQWIAEAPRSSTPTTVAGSSTPLGVRDATGQSGVTWFNQDAGSFANASPASIIATVWERSNQRDRFVQASRSEVARALPGVAFPTLIPEQTISITSQLVFDPETGDLASDAVAAFGFWSTRPYSKNRSVAQVAVLMVSLDEQPSAQVVEDTIGVPEETAAHDECEQLAGSSVRGCWAVTLGNGCPAWSLEMTDGWRLVWAEDGYRYDLFIRHAPNADLPARMATSCEVLVTDVAAAMIETEVGAAGR